MLLCFALSLLSTYCSKGISLLAWVSFPCSLCFLFFRSNGIRSFQEVEKLQVLPTLQALVLTDNPCAEEPDYRLEVLSRLPQLQRLDKELIEEDEREEAEQIRQTRLEKKKVRATQCGDKKEVKRKKKDQTC